jgi:large conductance mechanosensitive channel
MGLAKEFRDFAVKGNALDMAVGIIIGAAFNKIVTSLVEDIIMPPIGWLIGGVDFKDLELILKHEVKSDAGQIITQGVAIRYGQFINITINFFIIAFTVFLMVKMINRLTQVRLRASTERPANAAGPKADVA